MSEQKRTASNSRWRDRIRELRSIAYLHAARLGVPKDETKATDWNHRHKGTCAESRPARVSVKSPGIYSQPVPNALL